MINMQELLDELHVQAREIETVAWYSQDLADVRPLVTSHEGGDLYIWANQGMRGYFTLDTANGSIDYWPTWGELMKQLDWE